MVTENVERQGGRTTGLLQYREKRIIRSGRYRSRNNNHVTNDRNGVGWYISQEKG